MWRIFCFVLFLFFFIFIFFPSSANSKMWILHFAVRKLILGLVEICSFKIEGSVFTLWNSIMIVKFEIFYMTYDAVQGN